TENIDKYLTEPVSNIVKAEMSQYLFLTANRIEPIPSELNSEEEIKEEALNEF
ncbi:30322_t:CDS:1, partial [Gigaspora margarita]